MVDFKLPDFNFSERLDSLKDTAKASKVKIQESLSHIPSQVEGFCQNYVVRHALNLKEKAAEKKIELSRFKFKTPSPEPQKNINATSIPPYNREEVLRKHQDKPLPLPPKRLHTPPAKPLPNLPTSTKQLDSLPTIPLPTIPKEAKSAIPVKSSEPKTESSIAKRRLNTISYKVATTVLPRIRAFTKLKSKFAIKAEEPAKKPSPETLKIQKGNLLQKEVSKLRLNANDTKQTLIEEGTTDEKLKKAYDEYEKEFNSKFPAFKDLLDKDILEWQIGKANDPLTKKLSNFCKLELARRIAEEQYKNIHDEIKNLQVDEPLLKEEQQKFLKFYDILSTGDPIKAAKTVELQTKTLMDVAGGLVNANTSAFGSDPPFCKPGSIKLWMVSFNDLAQLDPSNEQNYKNLSTEVQTLGSHYEKADTKLRHLYNETDKSAYLINEDKLNKLSKTELASSLKDIKQIKQDLQQTKKNINSIEIKPTPQGQVVTSVGKAYLDVSAQRGIDALDKLENALNDLLAAKT